MPILNENRRVTRSAAKSMNSNDNGVINKIPVRSQRVIRRKIETFVVSSSESSDDEDDFIAKAYVERKIKGNCTPPKQRRVENDENLLTPTKVEIKVKGNCTPPKQRHVENDENLLSPVNVGRKVNANCTPPKQRRVENDENLLSPTSLFKNLQINSPKKDNVLKPNNNNYQSARKALHSAVPAKLPGREREIEQLLEFVHKHLDSKTAGSLYVSGPPGTGKTASLSTILELPEIANRLKYIYLNCTAIKSSNAVFAKIAQNLNIESKGRKDADYIAAIQRYLVRCKKMVIFVLDEIDQLESRNQSVLYTIFEWPALPKSQLILIGIANALDLTDRMLPRLQARCELKPQLMHFSPYTKMQIVDIFKSRLESAQVLSLFAPPAIQMLAGKVAATSGDVRRALDIGRRVIEIVEQKKIQVVDMKQVMDVLNIVYGTQNIEADKDDCIPLQQKIIVCTLMLILQQARNKNVTVGKLHEIYKKVCVKKHLSAVDQAEFGGLCALIETRGIIKVTGKKDPRLNRVTLEWDEDEVNRFLKDKQLMSDILQDASVLGKL